MVKIFIDPGHGGNDSGAVGFGILEKDIVLDISNRVERLLQEYEGVEVRLSRTDDRSLTHAERCQMANNWGADLLISNHTNGFTQESANGFETYIHPVTPQRTENYQHIIHEQILREIQELDDSIVDRGKKTANFAMLRLTDMSAVLVEFLFITNRRNNALLQRADFREACAAGVVNGIAQIFDLQKSETSDSTNTYTVVAGDTLWELAQQSGGQYTVDDLLRWNPGVDPRRLQIGQTLNIGGSSASPQPEVNVPNPVLRRGMVSAAVGELQRVLNTHSPRFNPGPIDNSYGPLTEDAVRRYQEYYGVRPYDGIYGPLTAAKLRETVG